MVSLATHLPLWVLRNPTSVLCVLTWVVLGPFLWLVGASDWFLVAALVGILAGSVDVAHERISRLSAEGR